MSKAAEQALSENSEPKMKEAILKLVDSGKSGEFQAAMSYLAENRAPASILMNAIRETIEKVSKLSDPSKQVDFFAPLMTFLLTSPHFEKEAKDLEPRFVAACEKASRFYELAVYYDSLPFDEEDNEEWDILEHYLRLAECYQKGAVLDKANVHFARANRYIFRMRTPKKLLERCDKLRARLAIDKGDYIQATRSFLVLANSDLEDSVGYLRQAIVYVVLEPAGPIRQSLFNQIMADDRSKTLNIVKLVSRLNRKQLVMAGDLKEFEEELKGEYGFKMDVLKNSVKEHNLHGISQLYTSIELSRLAEIIGTSEAEVTKLVQTMIRTKRINATIDQPTGMVLYESQYPPEKIKDDLIERFCGAVSSIANAISKQ